MPRPNPAFAALPTSIFQHMTFLALDHDAINLGQGFPDEDGPAALRQVAAKALIDGPNQYPPSKGLKVLRQAVSDHARHFYNLGYDPEDEVVITSGGTEALGACILATAQAGEDFVLVEPTYDSYRPIVQSTGAAIRTVKLTPPNLELTEQALRAAIGRKTRAVLINSPHNPAGRAFTRQELETLARVVRDSDAVVICDEVYEHLTYDGRAHIPFATLAGMRERTLKIGSAGKIFSLTGWKVGWACGPRDLISVVTKAHQFLTFTTPPALQLGVAHGLAHAMDFPMALAARLQGNRDILAAALTRIGFQVLPCEGTYFLTAGIAGLLEKEGRANEKDFAFCERLIRQAGVALIPLSAFYADGRPDTYVRFAFCKKRALIEEAVARLEHYFARR